MLCQSCGRESKVWEAEFGMNIGALVLRFHRKKAGLMCAPCIHATFWTYTLTTLALGWWGVISFFLTPVIVIMNMFTYATVFFTKPCAANRPIDVDPAVARKLEFCREEMVERLLNKEPMQQIAEDIGARFGIGAEDVKAFYNRS